ncbi:hypothetical protein L687_05230 [Microbacterium maritypicum MF109]|uniref:Uncharacterized protein n=1 Tax=Microbacterium maritypicum MF109 TaxID=1333857 RepID=T5KJF0_MICMQ|nr:hypothetical protein L687_05230 [Microbacterium maritypicum MF109]
MATRRLVWVHLESIVVDTEDNHSHAGHIFERIPKITSHTQHCGLSDPPAVITWLRRGRSRQLQQGGKTLLHQAFPRI